MNRRFFHVDSDESLAAGQELKTRPIPDSINEPVRNCFTDVFPDGVSTWGFAYLFESHGEGLVFDELSAAEHGLEGEERTKAMRRARNRVIELIAELIRVHWAPERPSRLSSIFAYSKIEAAEEFRETRCVNAGVPIWEIEAEQAFGCDASWLGLGDSMPKVALRTKRYWDGTTRPGSFPVDHEHLLTGAVTVVRKRDQPLDI